MRTTEERFWEKVDKNGPIPSHCPELGPCWVYTGARSRDGYGRFRLGKDRGFGMMQAHRYALGLALGRDVPPDMHACHHCDNPACCNNETHLFEGTLVDNERDKDAKGRRPTGKRHGRYTHPERTARGSRGGLAKLTEDDVVRIKSMVLTDGVSQASVARLYRVTPTIVSRIMKGKIWKHVA